MPNLRVLSLAFLVAATIQAADTSEAPVALISPRGTQLSVLFSQAVTAGGPQTKPEKIRLPNANPATARVARANRNVAQTSEVTLAIDPPIADPKGLRVCFDQVEFVNPASAQKPKLSPGEVCADVQINVEEAKNAVLADLKSVPKNSNEKNISASGFVTTATSGSAGGADISLNPDLGIKGMTSFLNIKKTTQNAGDPKHFEAGARYQAVLPWARQTIHDMAAAATLEDMGEVLKKQQSHLIAGVVYDFAGKLEGDPTHFEVTNAVGDSGLSIRSMTKGFANRHGFWRGFLVPGALEIGRSLSQSQTTGSATQPASGTTNNSQQKPDWIARYKTGLGMTLYYQDWNSNFPFRRVDLDINIVMRNLFFKESNYNSETMKTETTVKGVRAYGQVDLKLYVVQSDQGRYGLKLSYNRGSLPPVFARVESFQFGFLFETSDDKTKSK